MPITAYINRAAGLRVHLISGRITAGEFIDSSDYYGAHPHLANTDLISLVDESADPMITIEDLEPLRVAFQQQQMAVNPVVILRSAWICPNVRAWALLEHWLNDRHSRDGLSTEVLLVAALDEASLLYDTEELALVRDWVGFEEIRRFDESAPFGR